MYGSGTQIYPAYSSYSYTAEVKNQPEQSANSTADASKARALQTLRRAENEQELEHGDGGSQSHDRWGGGRMLWHVAGLSGKEEMIECVLGLSLSKQAYIALYGSTAAAAEHVDAVFRLMPAEAQMLCVHNMLNATPDARLLLSAEGIQPPRQSPASALSALSAHQSETNEYDETQWNELKKAIESYKSRTAQSTLRGSIPNHLLPTALVPIRIESRANAACVFDPHAIYKGVEETNTAVTLKELWPVIDPAICCSECTAAALCTHFSVAWETCYLFHEDRSGEKERGLQLHLKELQGGVGDGLADRSTGGGRHMPWHLHYRWGFGGDALYRVPLADAVSGRVAERTGGLALSAYFRPLR